MFIVWRAFEHPTLLLECHVPERTALIIFPEGVVPGAQICALPGTLFAARHPMLWVRDEKTGPIHNFPRSYVHNWRSCDGGLVAPLSSTSVALHAR
jgi:hypothetical protein